MHSVLRAPSATGAAAASHGTNRLRSCVLEARAAALAGALLACAVVRVSECERARERKRKFMTQVNGPSEKKRTNVHAFPYLATVVCF